MNDNTTLADSIRSAGQQVAATVNNEEHEIIVARNEELLKEVEQLKAMVLRREEELATVRTFVDNLPDNIWEHLSGNDVEADEIIELLNEVGLVVPEQTKTITVRVPVRGWTEVSVDVTAPRGYDFEDDNNDKISQAVRELSSDSLESCCEYLELNDNEIDDIEIIDGLY